MAAAHGPLNHQTPAWNKGEGNQEEELGLKCLKSGGTNGSFKSAGKKVKDATKDDKDEHENRRVGHGADRPRRETGRIGGKMHW